MTLPSARMALLAGILFSAPAFAHELKPEYTIENGLSCGRTPGMSEGVECDAIECYNPQAARQFSTWNAFEERFLRDEARRAGLTTAISDFSDICPGHKYFSESEKELFWLDFLKLMAAFESSYHWLDAYDDLVDRKIVTERGFFQLGKVDCEFLPEVQKDYCAVHYPETNARCALNIMSKLVRSRHGKTIDAIAAHWGSMRSSGRNAEGGRRELLKAAFLKHPACVYSEKKDDPAPAVKKKTVKHGRRHVASAGDDRPQYDRLKPAMYPDPDFVPGAILPSYRPAKDAAAKCSDAHAGDSALSEACKRFVHWKHYFEVDEKTGVVEPPL